MARYFGITSANTTIDLSADRKGEMAFTVSNETGQALRARASVSPIEPARPEWFDLKGAPARDFSPDQTQQFAVTISVPRSAPGGTYKFSLLVASTERPDEQYTEGPVVSFKVAAADEAPKPVFPWWAIGLAGGLAAVALLLAVVALARGGREGPEGPQGPQGPQGLEGPAGPSASANPALGRIIEGEASEAAATAGTNKRDTTASGGQVRFGEASGNEGGLIFVGAATPSSATPDAGVEAEEGPLGLGLTRATFRLKVTNHTVQPNTVLARIGCSARRGNATALLDSREIRTSHFPGNNTWQAFTLYCDFRPDDREQRVEVGRFVTGITDLSVDFVQIDPVAGATVPPGMIAMFAGICPHGWTVYGPLRGRFPRGEPGADPASLNTGGNDDAIVVSHTHNYSGTTTQAGGHEHCVNVSGADDNNHTGNFNGVADSDANHNKGCLRKTSSAGNHTHGFSGATTSAGASGAGANMPAYAEVVFCVKS